MFDGDYKVFCFTVSAVTAEWKLCAADSTDVAEMRADILKNIIASSGVKLPKLLHPT